MANVTKYNYDKLFKKKRFVMKRGKDFECMPHSMAQQIRNAAQKQHPKPSVSIQILDQELLIIVSHPKPKGKKR